MRSPFLLWKNFEALIIIYKTFLYFDSMQEKYSLIIVGAGPAGLTASIYASRYNIPHLLIGSLIGGLATEAYKIENFPTEKEISGLELTQKMKEKAESLGAKIIVDQVVDITRKEKDVFEVKTRSANSFLTETIILCLGTIKRKLNLPQEEKFLGKGISYCATCDGPFFKEKVVAVVGGSDSAAVTALYLSEIAEKVYIIYRREELRAQEAIKEKVIKNEKIEIIYNNNVKELRGDTQLKEIILENKYKNSFSLKIDGLFVEIGGVPPQTIIESLNLETDGQGYIKIKEDGSTSIKGIWAAGDVTTGSNGFRQIITACAEGAIAADSVHRYLINKK